MDKKTSSSSHSDVATIVLAGGEGTRLRPLTTKRCKPAVFFGGRFRIIDVAISNALNAGMNKIYVVSQFLAESLDPYLLDAYRSSHFHNADLEILSPPTEDGEEVPYRGTADSVRRNLAHVLSSPAEYFVILSGDQLYRMDLSEMLAFAKKNDADLTIATLPVNQKEATRMGVMKIQPDFAITDFFEKPQDKETLDKFAIAPHIAEKHEALADQSYLASMGIYIFKRRALINLLHEDHRDDFGQHLIPTQLKKGKTFAYLFNGYWEDIGTVDAYYHANLKLTHETPALDLYSNTLPIYTQSHSLPSPFIRNTKIEDAIICDGSIIKGERIAKSMIGMRTNIAEGTIITDSIVMSSSPKEHLQPVKIGKNCQIHKAIIDVGATIGDNVCLKNTKNLSNFENEWLVIKDDIIVVKAGAKIPDNFSLESLDPDSKDPNGKAKIEAA